MYYYGPGMGALGYSDVRGSCNQGTVRSGQKICFRSSGNDAAAAQRMRCVPIPGDTGTVGARSDACQHYCCPSSVTQNASLPSPEDEDEDEGGISAVFDWVAETVGFPTQPKPESPLPMPGQTSTGKATESGFATYTAAAAERTAAAIDDENMPIEEAPADSPEEVRTEQRSWIEQYQTHITLASTVIGLLTFIIWLAVRKK